MKNKTKWFLTIFIPLLLVGVSVLGQSYTNPIGTPAFWKLSSGGDIQPTLNNYGLAIPSLVGGAGICASIDANGIFATTTCGSSGTSYFDLLGTTIAPTSTSYKMGVGTTTAYYNLDVLGTLRATTLYGDGSNLTGITGGTGISYLDLLGTTLSPTSTSYKLGVGTTTAYYNLDVLGNIRATNLYGAFTGNLTGTASTSTYAGYTNSDTLWTDHNSYPADCNNSVVIGIGDTLTCLATSTWDTNTHEGNLNSIWSTSTGIIYPTTITNRVGIGTTSPNALLSVSARKTATPLTTELLRVSSTTDALVIVDNGSASFVGINTNGPDRTLDVLHATLPPLRISQTDGTVYTDFFTNSSGTLLIDPSSGYVSIPNASTTNHYLNGNLYIRGHASSSMVIYGSSTDFMTFDTSKNASKVIMGKDLEVGPLAVDADSGAVKFLDMTITATSSTSTVNSLSIALDNQSILTVYGQSTGQDGNLKFPRVGIGTTTPKGIFEVATSTYAYASSSYLFIGDTGNVGIGTMTPISTFQVYGTTTLATTTLWGMTSCTALETDAEGQILCGVDDTGGSGGGYFDLLGSTVSPTSTAYKLGVGTTTAYYTLDVLGNIRATGLFGAFTGNLTGNANTATALAADPADCDSQVAIGINASGVAQCIATTTWNTNTTELYQATSSVFEATTSIHSLGTLVVDGLTTLNTLLASNATSTNFYAKILEAQIASSTLAYFNKVGVATTTAYYPLDVKGTMRATKYIGGTSTASIIMTEPKTTDDKIMQVAIPQNSTLLKVESWCNTTTTFQLYENSQATPNTNGSLLFNPMLECTPYAINKATGENGTSTFADSFVAANNYISVDVDTVSSQAASSTKIWIYLRKEN